MRSVFSITPKLLAPRLPLNGPLRRWWQRIFPGVSAPAPSTFAELTAEIAARVQEAVGLWATHIGIAHDQVRRSMGATATHPQIQVAQRATPECAACKASLTAGYTTDEQPDALRGSSLRTAYANRFHRLDATLSSEGQTT